MAVRPSCPLLLIHDDDAFRRALIAALDQRHFTVTYVSDGQEALATLADRASSFDVILLAVDLASRHGLAALDYIHANRTALGDVTVILLGEPDPELRRYAKAADETLLKPVDADFVAARAAIYCT